MKDKLNLENLFCSLEITGEKKFDNASEEIKAELKHEIKDLGKWSKTRGRRLPATLSRNECKALMTAHKKGKLAFRNNLIIRVLYASGIRVDELAELKFCDIFYDEQTIFVRSGKGDKDRYTCVDSETLEFLRKWQGDKDLRESVFGLSRRQLRRIVEKAGDITGISAKFDAMDRVFSCHSLRHAFATHCYENGLRVPTLRMLLGHEHLGTTMLYLYTAKKYHVKEYCEYHPLENNE
ncbi:MAG: tyrosine-type recombinase/integrase [Candidatus Margulisbacteria bacterium]|nr:tyrosine-type recombinase/integrase [Candidatus Margulisiibacteriota bacterium]